MYWKSQNFSPKKYLHAVKDENYRVGLHELHESHKLAEDICRYDLDDFDVTWLNLMNEEREGMGQYNTELCVPLKLWKMLNYMIFNRYCKLTYTVSIFLK